MESSKSDTDKLVIEYLLANGYVKAAAELQQAKDTIATSSSLKSASTLITRMINGDSSNQQHINDSKHVSTPSASNRSHHSGNGNDNATNHKHGISSHFNQDMVIFGVNQGNAISYFEAYEPFRHWAYESIDLCRDELISICFPIFVHCHLGLLRLQQAALASEFWSKWSDDHRLYYPEELSSLASIRTSDCLTSDDFLANHDFIREALSNKFNASISELSMHLLSSYLLRPEARLLAAIVNDKIFFISDKNRPSSHIQVISLPSYDHSKKLGVDVSYDLPPITWGVPGTGTMVERSSLYTGMTDYFQSAMPNTRSDRTYHIWLERILKPKMLLGEELPGAGMHKITSDTEVANPMEPTIAFASVMNSYEGMISMHISHDIKQVVTGYQDSSIRVYRIDTSQSSSSSTTSSSPFGKVLINYSGAQTLSMTTTLPFIPRHTPNIDIDEYPSLSDAHHTAMIELHGHSAGVCSVDQDLSTRMIISGSFDEHVRLWDTQLAQCVSKYHVESPVWDVKFHPMGYYFATANMMNSIHIYSIDHKAPIRMLLGHHRDVNVCHWHDNLSLIASGSDDRTACIWDIRAPNAPVRIFRGNQAGISAIQCSPYGNMLATGSETGIIQLYDVGTAKTLAIMSDDAHHNHDSSYHNHQHRVNQLSFSPNSEVLSAGYADCSIKTYHLHELRPSIQALSKASSSSTSSSQHHQAPVLDEYILPSKHQYHTKFTPIYHMHYTYMNLLVAGGPFSLERASGYTSLDTSLARANEKEAVTALGLSHPIPANK